MTTSEDLEETFFAKQQKGGEDKAATASLAQGTTGSTAVLFGNVRERKKGAEGVVISGRHNRRFQKCASHSHNLFLKTLLREPLSD